MGKLVLLVLWARAAQGLVGPSPAARPAAVRRRASVRPAARTALEARFAGAARRCAPARLAAAQDGAVDDGAADGGAAGLGSVGRAKAWLQTKLKLPDKSQLAALGASAFFAYGLISNINAALLFSFTWSSFRSRYPLLSPLADGAVMMSAKSWFPIKPQFFAIYAIYYATVGSLLRPFRAALAIAIAPKFDAVVEGVARRLPDVIPRKKEVTLFTFSVAASTAAFALTILVAVNGFCALLRVTPFPCSC